NLSIIGDAEVSGTLTVDTDGEPIPVEGTVIAYIDPTIKRYSWRFKCDVTNIKNILLLWGTSSDVIFHYGFVLVRGVMAPDFIMSPKSIITAHDTRYILKGGDVTDGNYLYYGNLNYGKNLTVKVKDNLFTDIYGDTDDNVIRFKPYWSGDSYVSELGEGIGMSVQANSRLAYNTIPYENGNPIVGVSGLTPWSAKLYTDSIDVIPSSDVLFDIGNNISRFKDAYIGNRVLVGDNNKLLLINNNSINGYGSDSVSITLNTATVFSITEGDIKYNTEYVFHSGTSIVPSADDLYDIGSEEYSWNTIFVHTLEPEGLTVTEDAKFKKGIDIWYGDDDDKSTAIRFYFEEELTEPTVEIYEPLRGRLRVDGKLGVMSTNISYNFSVGGPTGLQGPVRTHNLESWEDGMYDVGVYTDTERHRYRNAIFSGIVSSAGMSANEAIFGNVVIDSLKLNASIELPDDIYAKNITLTGTIKGDRGEFTSEVETANISASGSVYATNAVVSGNIAANNIDAYNTLRSNSVTITTDIIVGSDEFPGTIQLYGNESVTGNLSIIGDAEVSGTLTVDTDFYVEGDIYAASSLNVYGESNLNGNTTIGLVDAEATLTVYGDMNLAGYLTVDDLEVNNTTTLNGTLTVEDVSTFNEYVTFTEGLTALSDSTFTGVYTTGVILNDYDVHTYEFGNAIGVVTDTTTVTHKYVDILYDDDRIMVCDDNKLYFDMTSLVRNIPDAPAAMYVFNFTSIGPTVTIPADQTTAVVELVCTKNGVQNGFTPTIDERPWIDMTSTQTGTQCITFTLQPNNDQYDRSTRITVTQDDSYYEIYANIVQEGTGVPPLYEVYFPNEWEIQDGTVMITNAQQSFDLTITSLVNGPPVEYL
ncbi:MAG: hypothetical protein EZS28_034892, partial [Streblomastix strix]